MLMREALSNIFANSIEALEDGGLITIGTHRVNGKVLISNSDNGPGIPADKMAHLFEPFHSTKSNGHGLGLFAAKHIMEMHNGTVEIESEEGTGTTVTVTLPAKPASDEDPSDSSGRHLTAPSL